MPILQLLTCALLSIYSHSPSCCYGGKNRMKAILPIQGQNTVSLAGKLS